MHASLLSIFVIPGAGQFYNKEYKKGGAIVISFTILVYLTIKPIVIGFFDYLNTLTDIGNIDLLNVTISKPNAIVTTLTTIIWLYALADAYITAKKSNTEIDKQDNKTI